MARKTTTKKQTTVPTKAPKAVEKATSGTVATVQPPTAAPAAAPAALTPAALDAKAQAYLAELKSTDADTARDAATALGALADPTAVQPLIDVLRNEDGYYHSVVRAAAASSLAQIKSARAIDALIEALRDPIAEASAEAVRALATLGDPRAVPPLIAVVQNADGYFFSAVRLAAVLALTQLGGEPAAAALREVAANSWEDPVIREAAARHAK